MPQSHPPREQLIEFGLGKLPDDESLAIEQHLEVCQTCCDTLLNLKEDTFAELVRQSGAVPLPRMDQQAPPPSVAAANSAAPALLPSLPGTILSPQADALADLPSELVDHARYRVVGLLGRGGMGSVFRAEHKLMNRAVAIKLINSQLVRNPRAVERFRREVQAAARLSHPNIVAAYDAEQAGNAHFLVMEFVEGTDLASLVRQRGPLSPSAACRCIMGAAQGLQHAHERGMVHRDIKPHNLMLTPAGQVRILDFGLAGFVSESMEGSAPAPAAGAAAEPGHLTTLGGVMGTPDYMAPEQAADAHSADIRADIYSLGCTLYFLLTGKAPFESTTLPEKLRAHASQAPAALTAVRRETPAELARVVARMLAKNPIERFQTPAEVAAALAPFARVEAPRGRRARRLLAAALLGAAVVLGGLIYVETDKGQFIVETANNQVAVALADKSLKIRDLRNGREYELKPGKRRLPTGEYEIDVTELPDGLEVNTPRFALTRGGVARVTVRFIPKSSPPPVAAGSPSEVGAAKPAPQPSKPRAEPSGNVNLDQEAIAAAQDFLKVHDADRFAELRDMMSALGRQATSRQQTEAYHQSIRQNYGRVTRRELSAARRVVPIPGLPPGRYAGVVYQTDYERADGLWESLMLNVDADGAWRVNSFACSNNPPRLPPEQRDEPAQVQKTKLTEPPLRQRLETGANLVVDPSLEATALDERYPKGWGTGNLQPPGAYAHRVVKGGRTGQRGWLIEGDGQYAVVPTNRSPADRAFRYAARAWVNVEAGSAQIKLLYFDAQGAYLGENRGQVSPQSDGWRRLTMIDDLARFPGARSVSLALTLIGKGRAVFDDLELLAFPADKLPANFEAEYGGPRHFAELFNRWAGLWEAEFEAHSAEPGARPQTGRVVMTARKILGEKFLLMHSAGESNAVENLWLMTFDENMSAYRLWIFGSAGEAFERRGQWDPASQTLSLELVPPSAGVTGTSIDRFVGEDQVDSSLLVKSAAGVVTRDLRWSARRRKPQPEKLPEIPVAANSSLPPNDAGLAMLAGTWRSRGRYKPSAWYPQGLEQNVTERAEWILGGRFLMGRVTDEKNELVSLWLATYEPAQKANRFWLLSANGAFGQWRVAWDSASRGLHWRSIDMPSGWIGTGFNRWIDDETFESQVLVKDNTGRVLLDGTSEKRRAK